MKLGSVLVALVACSRGHHEPLEMTEAMHAQLTSITDYGCSLRQGRTERPFEECASKDGKIHAWLMLDDGKLKGVTYELSLPHAQRAAKLRTALHGLLDDTLLEALIGDLANGSHGWRYGADVRGDVSCRDDSCAVHIRWVYL